MKVKVGPSFRNIQIHTGMHGDTDQILILHGKTVADGILRRLQSYMGQDTNWMYEQLLLWMIHVKTSQSFYFLRQIQ